MKLFAAKRLFSLKGTQTSSCLISSVRHLSVFQEKEFHITGNFVNSKEPTIGSYSEVTHNFSQDEVNLFAKMCGDNNPLHNDPEFAKTTMFKGTIVHGIFVSSLFSNLFGRSIPGSIYVSQDLNFKKPVHVGKDVTARMEIIKVEPRRRNMLLTCSTTCRLEDGTIVIEGEAKVLIPAVVN
jgi:3-hydroxybutyryl-CoA dehydratase